MENKKQIVSAVIGVGAVIGYFVSKRTIKNIWKNYKNAAEEHAAIVEDSSRD